MPDGLFCKTCGQRHAELPTEFGADAPLPYYSIPESEREVRCELTADLCIIEQNSFLIRGCLEIRVVDDATPFLWGVWASISKENFLRAGAIWDQQGRESEPPFFGWLCTPIPFYPDTLHLKAQIHTRPVGQRPFIELEPTDHPLDVEKRHGISIGRVQQIAEALLHSDSI